MAHELISPEQVRIANDLIKWAHQYLMQENANIKRPHDPQTVCPFVDASIKKNSFYLKFHNEINGESVDAILQILATYIGTLHIAPPFRESEKVNKALLIVFPKIPENRYHALDSAHQLAKDKMVENGMMIGQFHPKCRTPAIHNPAWKEVSVAPYPLIAMRFMAPHDILFVGEKRQWFLHFHSRFAEKFERPDAGSGSLAHLLELYREAKKKFLP